VDIAKLLHNYIVIALKAALSTLDEKWCNVTVTILFNAQSNSFSNCVPFYYGKMAIETIGLSLLIYSPRLCTQL